jgi:hypothetical protein
MFKPSLATVIAAMTTNRGAGELPPLDTKKKRKEKAYPISHKTFMRNRRKEVRASWLKKLKNRRKK